MNPLANIPPVVKNLLIINVIFYIAMMLFDAQAMVTLLGVHYFDSPNFKIWQVITYMFMHSPDSLFHILFNMFALYTFGTSLEYVMGSKRFLNYYLLTGLGALVLQMLVQAFEVYNITGSIVNDISNIQGINQQDAYKLAGIYFSPMVGASGAIFGLLIAFMMIFPNVELMIMFIPVPIKAKYIVPAYILIELFLGVKQIEGDSIAHYAHLGGALFGFILVKLWGLRRNDRFYE